MNSDHLDICPFRHQAMATVFEVMIAGEDPTFAEQAAAAAFQEIDRIEQELSRYRPNSDIARINNLMPHQSVRVGLDAFQCLQIAAECWAATAGAFDPTAGALVDCWIGKDRSLLHPSPEAVERARARTGMIYLSLHEAACEVSCSEVVPRVDLGAIGKGYAVDKAGELLREWGVGSAMIHGGTSSVYAFGDSPKGPGWPVTLSLPTGDARVLEKVSLRDRSLGGSGIRKATHIIDPRTGHPVLARRAAWVSSDSAARSDAASTACMLMTHVEIERYCATNPQTWAVVVEAGEGGVYDPVHRFGEIRGA